VILIVVSVCTATGAWNWLIDPDTQKVCEIKRCYKWGQIRHLVWHSPWMHSYVISFHRFLSSHLYGIIRFSLSVVWLSLAFSLLEYINGLWRHLCILLNAGNLQWCSVCSAILLSINNPKTSDCQWLPDLSLTTCCSIAARCRTVLAEYNMSCDDVSTCVLWIIALCYLSISLIGLKIQSSFSCAIICIFPPSNARLGNLSWNRGLISNSTLKRREWRAFHININHQDCT